MKKGRHVVRSITCIIIKKFRRKSERKKIMKLAISGKGGVGKTTFSSLLIRTLNAAGKHVLAIDADPDANLASAVRKHRERHAAFQHLR